MIGPRTPASRSAVSNRSRMLAGVDGRSALGRRYRDLVDDLSAGLGDTLSATEWLQVRNTASLQLHVEDLTARTARGEEVSSEAMTRAANATNRALNALRRLKADRKQAPGGVVAYLKTRQSA